MNRLTLISVAIGLWMFILWIIFLANTGKHGAIFRIVATIPYGDKIAHIALFGTLALTSVTGLTYQTFTFGKYQIYKGILFTSLFVLCEEFSQSFIASRSFDFIDLAANAVGICAGWTTALLFDKKRPIKTTTNKN